MLQTLLKLILVKHPVSGKTDVILSLVVFAVMICGFKFLLDGMVINIMGHVISFGHTDSLSYGSILSPILGAHGFIEGKNVTAQNRVDDPDEDEQA
jgi:hypothetical protein